MNKKQYVQPVACILNIQAETVLTVASGGYKVTFDDTQPEINGEEVNSKLQINDLWE
ncbi:MAG: hypothetical protein SPJ39_03630 [Prevotella sp.]|nr:hypothetical protein [Prevotella sp.]MDY5927163.1 hypothetical protein [Prevotella sp.]